jgi:hypothetical protein
MWICSVSYVLDGSGQLMTCNGGSSGVLYKPIAYNTDVRALFSAIVNLTVNTSGYTRAWINAWNELTPAAKEVRMSQVVESRLGCTISLLTTRGIVHMDFTNIVELP